jgi:peptidoglycan/xylan/chitin deacetylase (PgdA/CDA1 family)
VDKVPDSHPQSNLFVSPDEFRRQMEFLSRNRFTVVSLEDIRAGLSGEKSLPSRCTAITFDDGFEDNYRHAFPIIREYGYPATIFMIGGKIRREGNNFSSEDSDLYLSLPQMKEMIKAGITIGSHGMTHRRLAAIPPEEARSEIVESRNKLEQLLECPIKWFCYPFGSFNKRIVTYVCEAGYQGALSVIRDNRVKGGHLYFLPRVMVMPGISMLHFRYYFSNFYHYLHRIKNRKRWDSHIKRINEEVNG